MIIRHHVMSCKSPYNTSEGIYGVSIFQTDVDMAVVVLTEIENNPGMSITNAVEHVASKAKRAFLAGIPSDKIIWVERYERHGTLLVEDEDHTGETFDLVTFHPDDKRPGWVTPSWQSLGNRDAASFWKILFQSDRPLDRFPSFSEMAKTILRHEPGVLTKGGRRAGSEEGNDA